MAKFAKELITSLTPAAKHARGGKVKGRRVTAVELPDVKAIRRSLRMSQNRFSAAYRIPLATCSSLSSLGSRRRICIARMTKIASAKYGPTAKGSRPGLPTTARSNGSPTKPKPAWSRGG